MQNKKSEKRTAHNKSTHFAAANSGKGFISYYGEIFGNEKIERRYIIKGGPGTGKSSFMRSVADRAELLSLEVKYFRCSSDPESLDGIIIDNRIAMMDGTAPHIYEPNVVGARDEIINLGEFWDADRLYLQYNDIAAIGALKANAYRRAYRFLSAAMNVEEVNRELASASLLVDKMIRAVGRILSSIPDGDHFTIEYGIINSIGMKGRVRLDTYERTAEKVYAVYDHYGLGYDFLLAVINAAVSKKLALRVSYDPLIPDLPDAVMLCDHDIAFVLCRDEDMGAFDRINMRRFASKDSIDLIKSEYRANRRLKEALVISALDALNDAGRYHFELETIYSSCMDFKAENTFLKAFFQKLF